MYCLIRTAVRYGWCIVADLLVDATVVEITDVAVVGLVDSEEAWLLLDIVATDRCNG